MRMIAGCSNYAVDRKGNVWNTRTGRKMKPGYMFDGYAQVKLVTDSGQVKGFMVRRLVAMAYCNAKAGCATVILKKKYRSNKPGQAERFNWGDRTQVRRRRKNVCGALAGKESQIIKYYNRGWTQIRIATKYGVSQRSIHALLKRNGVV